MRLGRIDDALLAADRALALAEHHDLEAVVTDAFINKGSSLNIIGRRREGQALLAAAVERAAQAGLLSMELRARNNLAAAVSEDDPVQATRITQEALEVARSIGDRSMYSWLLANIGTGVLDDGTDWDGVIAQLRDAAMAVEVQSERTRLQSALGLLQLHRGEADPALVSELAEQSAAGSDPEEQTILSAVEHTAALLAGDYKAAYDAGIQMAADPQQPQIGHEAAGHAAIWWHDGARVRRAADALDAQPSSGPLTKVMRKHFTAAAAAFEGRPSEAVAGFREVRAELQRLEQRATRARFTLDAIIALPSEPEVIGWAADARATFESLGM
jgi:hypothetical protein